MRFVAVRHYGYMAELGISQRALTLTGLIGLGVASYLAILLLLGVRLKDLKAATE